MCSDQSTLCIAYLSGGLWDIHDYHEALKKAHTKGSESQDMLHTIKNRYNGSHNVHGKC